MPPAHSNLWGCIKTLKLGGRRDDKCIYNRMAGMLQCQASKCKRIKLLEFGDSDEKDSYSLYFTNAEFRLADLSHSGFCCRKSQNLVTFKYFLYEASEVLLNSQVKQRLIMLSMNGWSSLAAQHGNVPKTFMLINVRNGVIDTCKIWQKRQIPTFWENACKFFDRSVSDAM